jgi:hypothetical protein
MPETIALGTVEAAAEHVGELFAELDETLTAWRRRVLLGLAEDASPAALDDLVGALVLPPLAQPEALLVGAGFIAAPELVGGRDLHFAWWLGPLDANPVFGATTEPTRLDLATRYYTEYLRDFRSLEWYSIPAATHRAHITGPYVDHLCACDYIVTVTIPVERDGAMIGVVGADLYVKRLERELLPSMFEAGEPLALVNEHGRVVVSTDPTVAGGSVLSTEGAAALECPGTPFRLVRTSTVRCER